MQALSTRANLATAIEMIVPIHENIRGGFVCYCNDQVKLLEGSPTEAALEILDTFLMFMDMAKRHGQTLTINRLDTIFPILMVPLNFPIAMRMIKEHFNVYHWDGRWVFETEDGFDIEIFDNYTATVRYEP